MKRIKLSPSSLTVQETLDVMALHIEAMTGNANFPTPEPTEQDFAAKRTALLNASTAYENAKQDLENLLATRDAALQEAGDALTQRVDYVQLKSNGDPVKLTSSGFSLREDPAPVTMTQVLNLRLSPSDNDGELIAAWDPVRGARTYQVQICTDTTTPPTNWVDKTTSTKSKCRLNDTLQSGQKVYARVRAIGANDDGAWSDLASKTVP